MIVIYGLEWTPKILIDSTRLVHGLSPTLSSAADLVSRKYIEIVQLAVLVQDLLA